MVKAYYEGKFSLSDVKSVWHIGDKRTVHLSAMEAQYVSESHHAQDVQMVILDFDHDTLTTSINGKTKALVTIDQKDCLMDEGCTNAFYNSENGYMNAIRSNDGGWKECDRRKWCNNIYYNAFNQTFKRIIKQAQHITYSNSRTTTDDYAFLPSEYEIFGRAYWSNQEGTIYPYYINSSDRTKKPVHYRPPSYKGITAVYWNRSRSSSNSTYFGAMNASNTMGADFADDLLPIAPAVCL